MDVLGLSSCHCYFVTLDWRWNLSTILLHHGVVSFLQLSALWWSAWVFMLIYLFICVSLWLKGLLLSLLEFVLVVLFLTGGLGWIGFLFLVAILGSHKCFYLVPFMVGLLIGTRFSGILWSYHTLSFWWSLTVGSPAAYCLTIIYLRCFLFPFSHQLSQ